MTKKLVFSLLLGLSLLSTKAIAHNQPLAAMAPLFIGELDDTQAWSHFRHQLQELRSKGIHTLSVDVWWGLVQPESQEQFNWNYYRRLHQILSEEQMNWIPILSTHACGGNVGDACQIPIPRWVWDSHRDLQFVSEAGRLNSDSISVFADRELRELYGQFYSAFAREFLSPEQTARVPVAEISLSLGASGELHFPAYHHHDLGIAQAQYPERGLFQAFGPRAESHFRQHLQTQYGAIDPLNQQWQSSFHSFDDIRISDVYPRALRELEESSSGFSRPSIDLFDWYQKSLIDHADNVLQTARQHLGNQHRFGIKIPGVHWHAQRHAELMNGFLSLSDFHQWNNVDSGFGYNNIFRSLSDIERRLNIQLSIYSTAGATANASSPQHSHGENIVRGLQNLARRYQMTLGLENALAADIYNEHSLQLLEQHLRDPHTRHLTLLRMEHLVASPQIHPQRCSSWIQSLL